MRYALIEPWSYFENKPGILSEYYFHVVKYVIRRVTYFLIPTFPRVHGRCRGFNRTAVVVFGK